MRTIKRAFHAVALGALVLVAPLGASALADDYVVVLDPGHGGRDGGAAGRGGTVEKIVTLRFAERVREHLEETVGVAAHLTREDDTAVSLRNRVAVAREKAAHLFISIHADSIRHAEVRGASIYTLSEKASDRIAQSLADGEARSDVLAGFAEQGASAPEVGDILLDLMRDETEAFSRGFADRAIGAIAGHAQVIGNPHRSANFQVLRAPDVPSVLIELGYLSNRDDERLLSDDAWLDSLARILADAIVRHATDTGALREAAAR